MRLKQIEKRLSEISQLLTTKAESITNEEITQLETEIEKLQEEKRCLIEAAEKRKNLLLQLTDGAVTDDNGNITQPTVTRSFSKDKVGGTELSMGKAIGTDDNVESRKADKYASMEYRTVFMNYVCRGTAIPMEYRTDSVTKTTDVGAVIPTTVLNKIITQIENAGNILALVTRTAYKGGVTIPVSSVKPVATWTNEGSGSDKQNQDTKGSITFTYHKLRCAVAVSFETDVMSITAFEELIINNIVEAMTIALEKAIVSGSGTGQPKGIIKETIKDDRIIEVEEPAYDDLINAEAALPVAYEKNARWCMSKKTYMTYYGITDKSGQPIGRINYGLAGRPEYTLLGRPVEVCDYLPSVTLAEDEESFAFLFDFKNYVLNTNYTMGIKKYEDNETDDLVTRAISLADGKTVDNNGLVLLKKKAAV